MNAILFINGVYVLIEHKIGYVIRNNKIKSFFLNQNVITTEEGDFRLYGGRVRGHVCDGSSRVSEIWIDGFRMELTSNVNANENLVVAYLNQIEQLGVDTFLENYKNVVAKKKEYISGMCDKLVSELQVADDEDKRKMLNGLRDELNKLVGLLFLLMVSMNAGLDNQTYTDAQTECENFISEFKTNADQ